MFGQKMFAKDVSVFTVKRQAEACQPATELHSIASCFSEVMSSINDANGTDDCIVQMKFLTAGFVQ